MSCVQWEGLGDAQVMFLMVAPSCRWGRTRRLGLEPRFLLGVQLVCGGAPRERAAASAGAARQLDIRSPRRGAWLSFRGSDGGSPAR